MMSWSADPTNPIQIGTVLYDIVRPNATFTWRQSPSGGTAVNKMSIDANNILTLYKASSSTSTVPVVGVTINPETGVINLNGTGTTPGIFANGTSLFTYSQGLFNFGNTNTVNIGSNTPAGTNPSLTGSLTVAGGVAISMDSYINGVKIGKGQGTNGNNTAVGKNTLWYNSSGLSNSAFGHDALFYNNYGSFNTAIGTNALRSNFYGGSNTAIGANALYSNYYSSSNTAVGSDALYGVNYGGYNTGVGDNAGYSNGGSSNVFLGFNAGRYQWDGASVLNSSKSVYIGANARGFDYNDNNSIVIGADAIGAGANTTVIGNSNTQKTVIYGNSVQLVGGTVISSSTATINFGTASVYGATAISGGTASGLNSFAVGSSAIASATGSVAFGRYNKTWTSGSYLWVETDPLLLVGNGTGSAALSNAITTLKNGQTTLSNRGWNATPRETPSSTNSYGEALVVEGNTVLKGDTQLEGKVTISVPQGDISMGIYQ